MAYPRAAFTLIKTTLWLPEDDWQWLKARSRPQGAARVVRDLIHEHRRKMEELEAPRKGKGWEAADLERLLNDL